MIYPMIGSKKILVIFLAVVKLIAAVFLSLIKNKFHQWKMKIMGVRQDDWVNISRF